MNEIESYEKALINMSPKKWPTFLMEHAFVSGNKINNELAETFAQVGTLMDFKQYVDIDHIEAPEGSKEVFLTYCGVLGYGVYLSRYFDAGLLAQLRATANDPRITIRKAVIKALQYIGRKKFQRLLDYVDKWKYGTPLEQRACLAAVCSPELMKSNDEILDALELLEWITATFVEDFEWNQDYEVLQQQVVKCWGKVVAVNPAKGKPMMERWMKEQNPLVNIIMKKSLSNDSLQALDEEWANKWLQKL